MQLSAACIQLSSGADIAANIAQAEALVTQAAEQGAQLVALPENAFYMRDETLPLPVYPQAEHPGVLAAQHWAKQYRVWVLVGSVAIPVEGEKRMHNRSLLFTPEGTLAASYNKIHLFDVEIDDGQVYRESARFAPGAEAVVVDTPWGGMGVTVCYDLRFPQLYRALAKKGARILTVPAAFTHKTGEAHWHVLLRARAIENACFVLAPAQCGTHPGERKTYGHSMIIDPWGRILAERDEPTPGIAMATLDMDEVTRVRNCLPSLEHDREFS